MERTRSGQSDRYAWLEYGKRRASHWRPQLLDGLGIKLSRTRYRHPDGNALVERIFLSLKREEVWPSEYESFAQALAAVQAWIDDYNRERPHQALGCRTPSEVRAAALTPTQSAA